MLSEDRYREYAACVTPRNTVCRIRDKASECMQMIDIFMMLKTKQDLTVIGCLHDS